MGENEKPSIFTATVQPLFRITIPPSLRRLWDIKPKDCIEVAIIKVSSPPKQKESNTGG